jgi:hypothetical protein
LWCKENDESPEYDDIEFIKGNQLAIDHIYYHANIYAEEHGFKLDGIEYIEPEENEELLEGKIEDVEHIGHGVKYKNEIFPGLNLPKRQEHKKYKFRVLAREGDKVKTINFGRVDTDKKQLSKLSKKYWEATWK